MDLPYYHGPLSKRACEKLLLQDGADGSCLLRDSESVPSAPCVCVLFKDFIYTYRIFQEENGYYSLQTMEGVQKQIFPNLKELISKFEKPNQGLVVALQKPITRSGPCLSEGRLRLELDDVYENCNSDYVKVLP
ncbi:SH2 domain-containing protein 1B [Pteropus alecto]|uniref:SH2 domain-containing protein 1B n=1 Tax=Pteropus alecto TaxID=9402 RepID=UPI0003F12316|nr:SH2 domain-containing protein 1B [Pteropus alecto]